MTMFLSCLLIDTGENPDRPRPGRLWLRNMYRVHQRLCMAFPTDRRIKADPTMLAPYQPEDFGDGHVHVRRADHSGFLYRVDPQANGRATILVQSAIKPAWDYAFHNAGHLLAAPPQARIFNPSYEVGRCLRFRLRANAVRRIRPGPDGRDGPRVSVNPTPEDMRGWLERRAARAGFRILDLPCIVPGYVYINKKSMTTESVRLRSVTFDGTLTVSDSDLFVITVASGIGPAKAFGFGLLSIAPVRENSA